MSEAWDLRSNIKNKPGSQGTLFQHDKSVLNPAQRWPRGYEPERQAEVRSALKSVRITGEEPLMGDDPRKRAQITDTIARSTVPVDHLRGLDAIHNNPEMGHTATYWPSRREIGIDMDRKSDESSPREDLIHELGHHHDNNTSLETRMRVRGVEASLMDSHPELNTTERLMKAREHQVGIAEAVADNYFTEHARSGGRKSKTSTTGIYEDRGLGDKYPGYRDVRPAALQPKQFGDTQGRLF